LREKKNILIVFLFKINNVLMTLPSLFSIPPSENVRHELSCMEAYRSGTKQFEEQAWEQAVVAFEVALTTYASEAGVSRLHIEEQLRRAQVASELGRLCRWGRDAMAAKDWTWAVEYLQQADGLIEPGLGQGRRALATDLAHAERGLRYQNTLHSARLAQSDGMLPAALVHYELALALYHTDYGPTRLELEAEYVSLSGKSPLHADLKRQWWPLVAVSTTVVVVGLAWILGNGVPRSAPPMATPSVMTVAQVDIIPSGPPAFPGGETQLQAFLRNQLQYPNRAQAAGVEGFVKVQFNVQPDGSLTDIKVQEGLGYGCSEEALRVIKAMPRWVPAQQEGRAIAMTRTLILRFEQS
jgi:TonB family protein